MVEKRDKKGNDQADETAGRGSTDAQGSLTSLAADYSWKQGACKQFMTRVHKSIIQYLLTVEPAMCSVVNKAGHAPIDFVPVDCPNRHRIQRWIKSLSSSHDQAPRQLSELPTVKPKRSSNQSFLFYFPFFFSFSQQRMTFLFLYACFRNS